MVVIAAPIYFTLVSMNQEGHVEKTPSNHTVVSSSVASCDDATRVPLFTEDSTSLRRKAGGRGGGGSSSQHPQLEKCLGSSYEPGSFDVICAKGKEAREHTGNRRFRILIDMNIERYRAANSKISKSTIVSDIVDAIRTSSPEGGFIKMSEGKWYQVSEHHAREKVGQSFRDRLHTDYKSSSKAKIKRRKLEDGQQQYGTASSRDDASSTNNSIISGDGVESLMAAQAMTVPSAGSESASRKIPSRTEASYGDDRSITAETNTGNDSVMTNEDECWEESSNSLSNMRETTKHSGDKPESLQGILERSSSNGMLGNAFWCQGPHQRTRTAEASSPPYQQELSSFGSLSTSSKVEPSLASHWINLPVTSHFSNRVISAGGISQQEQEQKRTNNTALALSTEGDLTRERLSSNRYNSNVYYDAAPYISPPQHGTHRHHLQEAVRITQQHVSAVVVKDNISCARHQEQQKQLEHFLPPAFEKNGEHPDRSIQTIRNLYQKSRRSKSEGYQHEENLNRTFAMAQCPAYKDVCEPFQKPSHGGLGNANQIPTGLLYRQVKQNKTQLFHPHELAPEVMGPTGIQPDCNGSAFFDERRFQHVRRHSLGATAFDTIDGDNEQQKYNFPSLVEQESRTQMVQRNFSTSAGSNEEMGPRQGDFQDHSQNF